MDQILTTIIWAAIIQGLLLGGLFLVSKKHRSKANRILGLLMFAFVIQAMSDLLPYEQLGGYPLGYFSLPEVKLFFPALYLHFILLKVGRYQAYHRLITFHYWIGLGINILFVANVLLFLGAKTSLYDHIGYTLLSTITMSQQYYAFVLSLVVLAISIIEARNYSRIVKDEVSDYDLLNITWLWQFIGLMAIIILLWGVELMRILLGGTGQSVITLYIFLVIAILNYFVSYKAFMHRTLFEEPQSAGQEMALQQDKNRQTVPDVPDDVCMQVQELMEKNKYYLIANLSVHDFAKKIDIPARSISWCINNRNGLNFNEWVNRYRVLHARELLSDPKAAQLSIEGIGYDSGFTSRSAMYAAFHKEFGHSPGHFR